jgi:hypothetical protein
MVLLRRIIFPVSLVGLLLLNAVATSSLFVMRRLASFPNDWLKKMQPTLLFVSETTFTNNAG